MTLRLPPQLETVFVLEGLGPSPEDGEDRPHPAAASFEDQARVHSRLHRHVDDLQAARCSISAVQASSCGVLGAPCSLLRPSLHLVPNLRDRLMFHQVRSEKRREHDLFRSMLLGHGAAGATSRG